MTNRGARNKPNRLQKSSTSKGGKYDVIPGLVSSAGDDGTPSSSEIIRALEIEVTTIAFIL